MERCIGAVVGQFGHCPGDLHAPPIELGCVLPRIHRELADRHAGGNLLPGYPNPADSARPVTHELPVDVALGKVDYYEALMNRVLVKSGKLDYRRSLAALKAGRSFATNGPCGGEPTRSTADAEYFLAWIDRLEATALAHEDWNTEQEKSEALGFIRRAPGGVRGAKGALMTIALWFLAPLLAVATPPAPSPRPRLVVAILIDQFRPDYLHRFRTALGPGGFNLFLQRGASFAEARYRHGSTLTCPGHAVTLTGSHASVNGIVANSWYDAKAKRVEYCAGDSSAALIGAVGDGRSPRSLIGSTVGDELKLGTAGRSRVITVAGKDRSAIMLGGHLADGAYWMHDTLIVTSTYYMKDLPGWVRRLNASHMVSGYSGKVWDRLLAPAAYAIVGPDNVAAEEDVAGLGRTFPYRLPDAGVSLGNFLAAFEASPYQNEVILDFARRAVIEEHLGQDESPDLLAIGLSANDLVGHAYGPDSHEVMDMTVRTDRQLERFFALLADRVGLSNVLVMLTADHGVAPLPELVRRLNPRAGAGRFDPSLVAAAAESALVARYGSASPEGWIAYHSLPMLYLNSDALRRKGLSMDQAEQVAKVAIERVPGVHEAFTTAELQEQRNNAVQSGEALSYYPGRSGNIYYTLHPYLVPGRDAAGTTHGSPWSYDAQVPLLWFGASIKPGVYHGPVSIADIAPTLAAILGVTEPDGSQGRVLDEMLR